jgi:hypothetical protein
MNSNQPRIKREEETLLVTLSCFSGFESFGSPFPHYSGFQKKHSEYSQNDATGRVLAVLHVKSGQSARQMILP